MVKIAVYCETHNRILDQGEVDKESSLLLWNDFTRANEHKNCLVMIRLRSNCPARMCDKCGFSLDDINSKCPEEHKVDHSSCTRT